MKAVVASSCFQTSNFANVRFQFAALTKHYPASNSADVSRGGLCFGEIKSYSSPLQDADREAKCYNGEHFPNSSELLCEMEIDNGGANNLNLTPIN